MTTDAKIGLLIGLLFIIVISFLINGFPESFPGGNGSGIIDASVPAGGGHSIVIEQVVSDVARQLPDVGLRTSQPPQGEQVVHDFSQGRSAASAGTQDPPIQTPQPIALPPIPVSSAPRENNANPQNQTKVHVVQSGENLPVIAIKYYGSEIGNKRDTIRRLYEINKSVIPSADLVRVGDCLKIPAAKALFKPVSSASFDRNQRNFLNNFRDLFEPASAGPSPVRREYIVQEGDRLWDIAEKILGDGSRYKEIARLNKLNNPNHVPAGHRLKIPAR